MMNVPLPLQLALLALLLRAHVPTTTPLLSVPVVF
jgi:hypothetical protein